MWHLYVIISMLTAAIMVKVANPLRGRGRHRGTGAVTAADRRLMRFLVPAVPVVSLSLYLLAGNPDLPGAPAMFGDLMELQMRQAALLSQRPMETLLKKNPDDLGANLRMAMINQKLGRYPEAVRFMQHGVLLATQQKDMLLRIYIEDLGRLEVQANNGVVGDDALGTFAYARSISDTDPIARYYEALAKAQKGDIAGAIDDWNGMLSEGAALTYWKQDVRAAIAAAKAGKIRSPLLHMP